MRQDRRPPVFLDRDGTLIVERGYLNDPDKVILEEGAIEGLRTLRRYGHPLFVLSNQSGIGRGKFKEADAHRINARIAEILRHNGVEIAAWYLCPHVPESGCACRKPLPGMALAASQTWGLELGGSYVVGDKRSDLELADAIGGTGILVTTGHGHEARNWALGQRRPVFDGLNMAASYITEIRSA